MAFGVIIDKKLWLVLGEYQKQIYVNYKKNKYKI
jgi:hypothetical protein